MTKNFVQKLRADVGMFLSAALVIASAMLLTDCNRKSGTTETAPANWEQTLKDGVVGDWEQAYGSREELQFSSDGTLVMNSPAEHHNCKYDFPDYQHIRLDCAVPGVPSNPQSWKISLSGDTLKISDALETGVYQRKQ